MAVAGWAAAAWGPTWRTARSAWCRRAPVTSGLASPELNRRRPLPGARAPQRDRFGKPERLSGLAVHELSLRPLPVGPPWAEPVCRHSERSSLFLTGTWTLSDERRPLQACPLPAPQQARSWPSWKRCGLARPCGVPCRPAQPASSWPMIRRTSTVRPWPSTSVAFPRLARPWRDGALSGQWRARLNPRAFQPAWRGPPRTGVAAPCWTCWLKRLDLATS